MAFAIAIMAAGKGTRLNSKRPKVLHEIGGKSLLRHVIDTARQVVPARDIHVIIGHQADMVRSAVEDTGVRFVLQNEQRGTGHAMQQAIEGLRDYEHVLVLSGDVPLLRRETLIALRDFHIQEHAAMTVLSAVVERPHGYGRIVRKSPDSPEIRAIVEQKALKENQESIREINSGIYAFSTPAFTEHIDLIKADNAQRELYLTDIAGLLAKAHQRVMVLPVLEPVEVLGANTIPEMMELDAALRKQTARRHMEAGVTIFAPDTVVVDAGVEIAADAILEPYVQLRGTTRIGSGSRIQSFSVLENSVVGQHALLRQGCIIENSEIRDNAILGPYAHLRPESFVDEGAHVGNFVELKKTHMGAGAKAGHLAYLGDTEIGAGTNIGAGTIVCNYDGVQKHKTRIGAGAFIGSDSVLVAPISIGEGAYVAAASCVTEDVPAQSLAIARAKQTNKPQWAATRRATQSAWQKKS